MFGEKEMIINTIKYIVTIVFFLNSYRLYVYLDFFTVGFTTDNKDLHRRSWHKIWLSHTRHARNERFKFIIYHRFESINR